MNPQTKRKKAEIIVALVRAEFPHCVTCPLLRQKTKGPCVGDAYYRFREAHPEMGLPKMRAAVGSFWYDSRGKLRYAEDGLIPSSITCANDLNGPAAAWSVLADELVKVL